MTTTCLLYTTQNRTQLLVRSLGALFKRTLPDEILVVDDGGSDHCEEIAAKVMPIRYIYNDHPEDAQCSEARNIGIKSTDCDVVITCEPEVMFITDVIAQMLEARELDPTRVVSAGSVWHEQPHGPSALKIGWVAPYCAAYDRQWLLDVGGWDESFPDPWGWEDTDLLTRLRYSGHGQQIVTEIEVLHQYHEPRWCDQINNEEYFRAKDFDGLDLVANRGVSWGSLRS